MKDIDLAWAAGIIDGEGCIYISKAYQLYIRVTMTDYPTIARLHTLFSVGTFSRATRKCMGDCRPAYSWVCAAKATQFVLLLVRPYLFTKLDQAEIALEYLFTRKTSEPERTIERQRLYMMMKICKEKEWDWSTLDD